MRRTTQQINLIQRSVAVIFGENASIMVYGSRLDDQARGGDLDLLITADEMPTLLQKARLKLELETALVMLVDILGIQRGAEPTAFQRIALINSVFLGAQK